jgi:homoserine kinase type II
MAIYTPLSLEDADRIARAHDLGRAHSVLGVLAGSVNSNFFVETDSRRVFVRIYEEQETRGLAYEWALLAHLARAGVPVPRRVEGPEPGVLRVAGKPVAIFECVGGSEICQRGVDEDRARAVGHLLARMHVAQEGFAERREGRFTLGDVAARLAKIRSLERPELARGLDVIERALDEVRRDLDLSLPRGVIHGDLFRDNVRWEERAIVGVLDWESASDGLLVYDLAVTILAWCYGDRLEWPLARAMCEGYVEQRSLCAEEKRSIRDALRAAAVRFATTRITDYHLREGAAQVKRDWRRFLSRLEETSERSADEIAALLF